MISKNKQKSNCFTLSLAHRYTSASLLCDLGHFPFPVPTKATSYPLTILLRRLPAPLGSPTENVEPVRCGLPQCPTHRPTNFSNTAPSPFLTPRLSLERCRRFNSNPSLPVAKSAPLQDQDLIPPASFSLDFWSVPLHWQLLATLFACCSCSNPVCLELNTLPTSSYFLLVRRTASFLPHIPESHLEPSPTNSASLLNISQPQTLCIVRILA